MSKQEDALQYWGHRQDRTKVERLLALATDYSFPAGQAQAGIQLATVEVPKMLEEIEFLRSRLYGTQELENIA